MEMEFVTTSLPKLKIDESTVIDPRHTFEFGMIYADKPFSLLTPEHGFVAEIYIPPVGDSIPEGAQPVGARDRDDIPRFRYLEMLNEEKKKIRKYSQVKVIRCIIDESSDYTVGLRSVFGLREQLQEGDHEFWIGKLGHLHIAGSFLSGYSSMNLVINGRTYCMQDIWVTEKLFPTHKNVEISVVLGRDFLCLNPGLILEPIFRGKAVDLVPWNTGYDGENFEINSRGELIAYVSGYDEEGMAHTKTSPKASHHGYFGVFFGQNSDYNMSMQCTSEDSPLNEAAVVEGALCVVYTAVMGRMETFNSIRIRTDSQGVIDMLKPGGKLKEYEKRDWTTSKGKKLNLHKIFNSWAKVVLPELDAVDWDCFNKDMIVFEKVDKKSKGLQAARHLAQSGKDSQLFYTGDRGICALDSKHDWEDYLFTHVPVCTRDQVVRVRHPREAFIKNRKLASDKAPHEDQPFTPPQIAQLLLAGFFPQKAILGVIPFAKALEKERTFSALQILAISGPQFIEDVLEIAMKEGRVEDYVELLSAKNGEFCFSDDPDEESADVVIGLGLGDRAV